VALAEIMQGIEQYRFSSELNLAAGTKAFRRGLREHDLVRRLADLAKEAETRVIVANRIEELSQAGIDTRYENRFDAALSAYLMVLSDTEMPEIVAKAAAAAAKAPNCWWTAGFSRELLMHAVATGVAQAVSQRMASANDDTARHILAVLRAAQTSAQIPPVNNVIVMPPPTEEGERVTWRRRGRSRTARVRPAHPAASMHPRGGRHASRA